MSVREEDRQKTGCTGRGLGIAAAVGVGVGAALYYFLSKRPEQPDTEGSTSSAWAYNDHSAFPLTDRMDSDSYSTISEHSTSDTSIIEDSMPDTSISSCRSESTNSVSSDQDMSNTEDTHSPSNNDTRGSGSIYSDDAEESDDDTTYDTDTSISEISDLDESHENRSVTLETGYLSFQNVEERVDSDSDIQMEWDITNSSIDVPFEERRSPLMMFFSGLTHMISPRRKAEDSQINRLRDEHFV
uniref:Uncharacterized protein n=1 Tax=Bombyx mori TaxID=7091 RepID=A0A8R2M6B8_BOMMO|nr:dentin sialophosphoprotein-like isoform X2 [Bombyx mori]